MSADAIQHIKYCLLNFSWRQKLSL